MKKNISIVALSVFLGALLNIYLVNAGSNTISSVTGGVVRTSHVNQYFQALTQDLVPRNSSGVATSEAGNLGGSTFPWKNAVISTGYWGAGDVKCKHTYNGLVPIEQGWMRMDGDIVNQTNYDSEHGAGSWANYIGSSPLDGKHLPNLNSKYIVGSNTTPQDGTSAITSTGNVNHQINLNHSHDFSVDSDKWYNSSELTNVTHNSWDAAGSPKDISGTADSGATYFGIPVENCSAGGVECIDTDFWTEGVSNQTTQTSLSATQSVQPESIQFVCYMRII